MKLSSIALLWAAVAAASPTDDAVARVRAAWQAIQSSVEAGDLRSARLEIGGGQNPSTITVHYEGGTDADFEQDPYATPFRVRRIDTARVLPAVGPASASFWYDTEGRLIFAYTAGADISGVSTLSVGPVDELRVYYAAGEPARLLWDGPQAGPTRRTFDLPGDAAAQAAAVALQRRGRELREACEVLAR